MIIDQTDLAAREARRPWKILFPAGLSMALSLAGDLTLYAVLATFAGELGLELATLGVLLSANRLIRLVSNPIVGLLTARFSRRRFVLAGLTSGTLSTLLYVIAAAGHYGFWMFLLGRVIWGISWSILYIGIYCMMLDVTGDSDRGWGSGLLQTFYFFGLALTPLVGGFLSDRIGFVNAMLVCTAIQAVGLLLALILLPETHLPQSAATLPSWGSPARLMPPPRVRRWLSEKAAGLVTLAHGLGCEVLAANYLYLLTLFIGDGIIMSTVSLYLKQRYGDMVPLDGSLLPVATASGLLIALRAVISAGAAPLAGRWSDRLGRPWMLVGLGVVIAFAGCLLLGLNTSTWLILGGIVLASFGSGVLMALLPAIIASLTDPQNRGLSVGLLNTSGDIGCSIAPLFSYALLGRLSLNQIYLISAGLFITGLVVIGLLPRAKTAQSETN